MEQQVARRMVRRPAAFAAAGHVVLEADVGEGAAHEHFVVAAARAVGVEVGLLHAVGEQVALRPGVSAPMEPAGEMWSVVTESPKMARIRPPVTASGPSSAAGAAPVMPSKNGGSCT